MVSLVKPSLIGIEKGRHLALFRTNFIRFLAAMMLS